MENINPDPNKLLDSVHNEGNRMLRESSEDVKKLVTQIKDGGLSDALKQDDKKLQYPTLVTYLSMLHHQTLHDPNNQAPGQHP